MGVFGLEFSGLENFRTLQVFFVANMFDLVQDKPLDVYMCLLCVVFFLGFLCKATNSMDFARMFYVDRQQNCLFLLE